ncbi:protein-er retention protein [Grosmannia clavigera kw1407]|uniref:Protein-er retention protein n=1 Tax=Grosmannia clavigera (strain kw1407 / UAMH 11150) TaxID=655863 RepID=F0XSS9_GROCL|nr:protein-er retention protein [Grosmannia clavigera kw1407]EFW99367.1 protein-er retention protein [Grosmannia clavigera kw1407]
MVAGEEPVLGAGKAVAASLINIVCGAFGLLRCEGNDETPLIVRQTGVEIAQDCSHESPLRLVESHRSGKNGRQRAYLVVQLSYLGIRTNDRIISSVTPIDASSSICILSWLEGKIWQSATVTEEDDLGHDIRPSRCQRQRVRDFAETMGWTVFRILGDCVHLLSKCILMFAIHRNRSAEGISLITQILYAVIFCTRYLDVFSETSSWNLFFKIFYIVSSFYIIAIMKWVYPRSREKELAWKMGATITLGSLLISPFGMMIFESKRIWSFRSFLWSFSEILESVAVLPQLLLLRQTTVPTVIDSFYLLALGSYRGLYILNWIQRAAGPSGRKPNGLSVTFGIIQTLFYLDFAWVYWTRQRVKLRNGGVVDADDIRHGWLINRVLGKHVDQSGHDDEESAPALGGRGGSESSSGGTGSRWGVRGISVSADDATLEHEGEDEHLFAAERSDGHHNLDASVDPDAKMQDPDELARALDDDDEDDDDTPPLAPRKDREGEASGVRNDEWAE